MKIFYDRPKDGADDIPPPYDETSDIKKCSTEEMILSAVLLLAAFALTVLVFLFFAFWGHPIDPCAETVCPPAWFEQGRKCFHASLRQGNWSEARSACKGFGATLPSDDSELEVKVTASYETETIKWLALSNHTNRESATNGLKKKQEGCPFVDVTGVRNATSCSKRGSWLCVKTKC
ncbi:F-lec2 protein [Chelonid alphaherpesvirus 5]|uniref:F-lec2 protein n=1 Tax=Chelonid alphaherpesvirus 5 TaxID=702736 RepID=K7NX32_9ALPH|nr:F-lec2 protein [Chelonid alphaherpesvirus 5]AEZ68793.1 F-lec2 protein [Chelonid alphaherpesvirus 5]